jgi:hypothetical protein
MESHLWSSNGTIRGTVKNLGTASIRSARLYVPHGEHYRRVSLATVLHPGETVSVDAAPAEIPARSGLGSQKAGEDALADYLGTSEPPSPGLARLIGFTDPVPRTITVDGSQPSAGSSTALVEAPVRMEASDGVLDDWTEVRLASSTGVSDRFVDVYDLELPRTVSGPLLLAIRGRPGLDPEIYDWASRSWVRGWRPGTAPQNGQVTGIIAPTQVHDGLIRVRVVEPVVDWGIGISVRTTATDGSISPF